MPARKTVNCAIPCDFKPPHMSHPGTGELEQLRPYLLRYALLQLRDQIGRAHV